jgi:glycosyltransferase involved in cell wall biosynthesis
MRVLALTPNLYGFSPGQRSSIELWERVLIPAGISLHYVPFETERLHEVLYQPGHLLTKVTEMVRAYVRRLLSINSVSEFDAVLVYREAALLGPAFLEKIVARKGVPIIYQLDDPLYIPYRSPTNGYLSYLKWFSKVGEICKISSVVIVNSTAHRDYAAQFNSNIRLIPSVVDTERYRPAKQKSDVSEVCIGWSGSPTTTVNLQTISEPLQRLSGRIPHKLYFIGGTDFNLPGLSYTAQKWNAETEVEDLQKMDIGLVPLPVNEWNKRKFNMKVVQYMALGIPPVCTPLGDNPIIIEPGVTGFLAETPDQWVGALETLAGDSELRSRMSGNAIRVAEEKYSLKANTEKIIDAFRAALN